MSMYAYDAFLVFQLFLPNFRRSAFVSKFCFADMLQYNGLFLTKFLLYTNKICLIQDDKELRTEKIRKEDL